MSTCYILRVRPDATVALQPALATAVPGLYITRAKTATNRWQLRLSCGFALDECGYVTLAAARQLVAHLGALPVDWTADYGSLCRHFTAHPDQHQALIRILARPADRRSGAA